MSTSPEKRNHDVHEAISELNYLEAHNQIYSLQGMDVYLSRTINAVMAMAAILKLSQ
jgi:hypothetical protein